MSIPVVYSSTDAGAPTFIPDDQTTWLALIKQCLVYGYTGKAAAGWTLAYEDTVAHTLVLQQGTGNKRYLWLGSPGYINNGGAQDIRYLVAQSYLYMTGINSGTGMYPGVNNTNWWSFANQYNATSTVSQKWVIVATSKFFLVYLYPTQTWSGDGYKPKIVYMFGDFKSNVNGDTYNTILTGYSAALGGYNGCFTQGTNTDMSPFNWGVGSTTPPNGAAWLAGPYYQQLGILTSPRIYAENTIEAGTYPGNGQNFFPDFCSNQLKLSGLKIQEFWNGTMSARGTLPGIYVSCFSPEHLDGTVISGTGDLAGNSFLVLNNPYGGYTWPVLYIQLTSWND